MKKVIFVFLVTVLLFGCTLDKNIDIQGESISRKWTFIIYMAADNDLDSAAMNNFKQLETVNYGNAPISILVLLDRHPSGGGWSDTRVYEVRRDPSSISNPIIRSPRLDCPELGLTKNSEIDLNTADPFVLSGFIDFAKRAYPAEHYALFIWGHGSGWRSDGNATGSNTPFKAFAADDTSGDYMLLPDFGWAIEGKGLSLIGFDTCFGAVMEVAYQVRNSAALLVGSEGLVHSRGWNYKALFDDFISKPHLSITDLGDSIQNQYRENYPTLTNATISQIQLSHVENLFNKFNAFSGAVATSITTKETKNLVMDVILNNVEQHYLSPTQSITPVDLFIDVHDFCIKINDLRYDITSDPGEQNAIAAAANELESALALAIPSSWAQNGTTKKIGVFVIPIIGIATPGTTHDEAYIRGSGDLNKSAFVEDSTGWVPNTTLQSSSLLDKLFYWFQG